MALGDPPKQVIDFPKMPRMPKVPAGGLRYVLLVLLALWLVFTSFYTIDPEEVGMSSDSASTPRPPSRASTSSCRWASSR